jgi:site-specific DNA-cytosine methylase
MVNNMDVIVLFSGCGGFSEGFRQAGFNIIYANDNWDVALQSHALNHHHAEHILADIRTLDEFPEADIIIGSPPCQKFSRAGKQDHEIGMELIKEFERVVKIVKPKYWVWENVPAVAYYYKNSCILDAYDFGLPQHRKRCFVSNFSFIRMNTLPGIETQKIIYDGSLNETVGRSKSGWKHTTCSGTVCTKRPRDASTNELLSIERVKELMGFPQVYKLFGGVTSQQKQLGNAVCPPVAKIIAKALL